MHRAKRVDGQACVGVDIGGQHVGTALEEDVDAQIGRRTGEACAQAHTAGACNVHTRQAIDIGAADGRWRVVIAVAQGREIAAAGLEHARDIQLPATFCEERARGVPQVIGCHTGVAEVQFGASIEGVVAAFIFGQAGEDVGRQRHRAVSGRADEAGGGGGHTFDAIHAERGLFNEDARGKVFGHRALLQIYFATYTQDSGNWWVIEVSPARNSKGSGAAGSAGGSRPASV